MSHGTESEFEETTIERLKALGWEHTHGTDLVRSNDEVVLPEVLREFLKSRYVDLPAAAIDEAVKVFTRPEGVDTLRRNTEELRKLLQTEGGEVIFTTIEKFRLRKGQGALEPDELDHPVLTERSNVIIIADEAHRTQYGFSDGYARHLADALPNAKRLGFTGTPVSFSGADTVSVFGEVIHTYDMKQSQDDKATVPIFYAPRQIKLHLSKADIDAALARIVADANVADADRRKSRWAALAKAAGAQERIDELSKDLLAHFLDRSQTLRGKAMIVCMTRENCVRLYDALRAIPGCPEIKVIMTGDLSEDPQEWNDAGHITTKPQRETIKKRRSTLTIRCSWSSSAICG